MKARALGLLGLLPLITVSSAHAGALADLAASMPPGSWAELPGPDIGVLAQGAHTGNVMPFAQSAHWDPVDQKLYFVGNDHNMSTTAFVYDEATNAWSQLGNPSMVVGHGYDHAALDVVGRRFFLREYGIGDVRSIYQAPLANPLDLMDIGDFPPGYAQVAIAIAYMPNTGLVVYNCGENAGQLSILDETTDTWTDDIHGFGGNTTYHCFGEISEKHGIGLFGGGNEQPNEIFRLNADRTVTPLPDAPIGLGIQQGNVAADPNTGDFLILGEGKFLSFDATGSGDHWEELTGTAAAPAAVGNPSGPVLDSVVSAPISNHGVTLYVTCKASNCAMHLYRHAPGNGIPVTNTGGTGGASTGGNAGTSAGGSGGTLSGPSSGGSGGENAGSGGSGAASLDTDESDSDSGCGFRLRTSGSPSALTYIAALAALALARRRRA